MGGGASSLIRLRKAIIIRSYNLRKPEETVDQQFRKFAVRGEDGILIISLHNIRNCLEMESKEYDWIDHLFLRIFGGQVTTVSYSDFIKFLESGKAPETLSSVKKRETSYGTPPIPSNHTNMQATPSLSHSSSSSSYRSVADASSIRIERMVRSSSNTNNGYYSNKSNSSSRASLHANRDGLLDTAEEGSVGMGPGVGIGQDGVELEDQEGEEEEEEEVLHINLSSAVMNPHSLPESVKLQSHDGFIARSASRQNQQQGEGEEALMVVDDTYTVIVHPSRSANKLSASDSPPKPLWRKRETVRQERTVHYTTIDASGEQQELIEKETTQSEVLHMECKETGQFAHRETTQYEQLETFNAEVVAETKGAEEYVHLKSLEDEFHYMESTMPNKEGEEGQQQQQQQQGGEGGEGEGMYGEPVSHGTAEEAAAAQAAMEAEYAEAYHLYHQKRREQQERGEVPSEQDEACADMFRMSPRQPPPPFSDDTHQAQGFGSGYSSSNNNTGCEGPSRGRGRGSGRSAEDERAREAFAFAEGMEDLDEPPVLHEEEEEEVAEQSQLFGEHIPCSINGSGGGRNSDNNICPAPATPPPPAATAAAAAASRQGRGLQGKEYLFEPSDTSTDTLPPSSSGINDNNDSSRNDLQHHLPPRIPTSSSSGGGGGDAVGTTLQQSKSTDAQPTDDYLSRTSSYESLHEID